jgi:hypothetical protein
LRLSRKIIFEIVNMHDRIFGQRVHSGEISTGATSSLQRDVARRMPAFTWATAAVCVNKNPGIAAGVLHSLGIA